MLHDDLLRRYLLVLTMDADQRDAWNARKMVVTVKDYCEGCKTLRDDVKEREAASYWPKFHIKKVCCSPCFEIARQAAIDEAKAESSAYC